MINQWQVLGHTICLLKQLIFLSGIACQFLLYLWSAFEFKKGGTCFLHGVYCDEHTCQTRFHVNSSALQSNFHFKNQNKTKQKPFHASSWPFHLLMYDTSSYHFYLGKETLITLLGFYSIYSWFFSHLPFYHFAAQIICSVQYWNSCKPVYKLLIHSLG